MEFQSAEPKKPKTSWSALEPLKPGNMDNICHEIETLLETGSFRLAKVIQRVLKKHLGSSKFLGLLTQNVSNGSNDQKRLILLTSQTYRNYIKKKANIAKMKNMCLICHKKSIDTILLPCNHEITCKQCAKNLEENKQKCLTCHSHVRASCAKDGPYMLCCGACGFCWDGMAQHECSANEWRLFTRKDNVEMAKELNKNVLEVLKGYDYEVFESYTEKDANHLQINITLCEDYFNDLHNEFGNYGLYLNPTGETYDGLTDDYIIDTEQYRHPDDDY